MGNHSLTTTERGLGWGWQKLRLTILKRDGYLCQPCIRQGRPTEATEVDHISPRYMGGEDAPDNLESICRVCHLVKSRREAVESKGGSYSDRLEYDDNGFPVWE